MRQDNPTTHMIRTTTRFLASSARSRTFTCCLCCVLIFFAAFSNSNLTHSQSHKPSKDSYTQQQKQMYFVFLIDPKYKNFGKSNPKMNHVMLGKTISRELCENGEFNEDNQRKGQKWKEKKKGNYKSNIDSTQGPLGFGFGCVCLRCVLRVSALLSSVSLSVSLMRTHTPTFCHFHLKHFSFSLFSFWLCWIIRELWDFSCQVIAGCNMLQKILFLFLFLFFQYLFYLLFWKCN